MSTCLTSGGMEISVQVTKTPKESQNQEERIGFRLMYQVGKVSWRRAWQLTPVFLPRESHEQRSLVG